MLVPLYIAELQGSTFEERKSMAPSIVDLVAHKADEMMYAPRKALKRKSSVLSAIAKGIAIMAYQPGGVTLLGIHACVYSHLGCPGVQTPPPCCTCGGQGTCQGWCEYGCRAGLDPKVKCCQPRPVTGFVCRVKE